MFDVRCMTYAELAAALGIGADSARNLVRRKRWHRNPGNDGLARVSVPLDYLERSDGAPHGPTNAPLDPLSGAPADGAADPPTAEPAASILARHISRLEKEIEELRQERDRAFGKASDRDSIATQSRALKIALCELREDRERWRCLAERLASPQPASRRWWRPWSRTACFPSRGEPTSPGALPGVNEDETESARSAARRAGLLLDNPDESDRSGSWSFPQDQAASLFDGGAPDVSPSSLERALERLAREAEHAQRFAVEAR